MQWFKGTASWAIGMIALVSTSCQRIKSVSFSKELRSDTVLYANEVNNNSRIAGTRVLGPYSLTFSGQLTGGTVRNGAVFINENSDNTQFTICKDGICAKAEASYFTRTKNTSVILNDKNRVPTRLLSERLSGSIAFPDGTAGFDVDIKRGSKGIVRLPGNQGTITIRPIQKKSGYGKTPYSVGLEFVQDKRIIGSFIQVNDDIRVALKKDLSEPTRMTLTALSVCLMNKSNTIKIL
jgi:hypothetical protein